MTEVDNIKLYKCYSVMTKAGSCGHQGRDKIISKLLTKKNISKLVAGFFTAKGKVVRLERKGCKSPESLLARTSWMQSLALGSKGWQIQVRKPRQPLLCQMHL